VRYYNIVITDPSNGLIAAQWTSFVNGRTIPGAQNVELDIPVTVNATPMGQAYLRIWGVSIAQINSSRNLAGFNIAVYGGMQAGLPLANPAQAKLLIQGQILQAFGNWIGTDQTMDMYIGVATQTAPLNLTLNWLAGVPLSGPLMNALTAAFPPPAYSVNVNISPGIVPLGDQKHFCPTLQELAQFVKQKSEDIVKSSGYTGVDISVSGNIVNAYDSTAPASKNSTTQDNPRVIFFQDLIGQPTWIEYPFIQFKTVLRGDVQVGDFIKLPYNLLATTTAPSGIGAIRAPNRNTTSFNGVFRVAIVRHVGNYRQADAASWVSIFNAYPIDVPT